MNKISYSITICLHMQTYSCTTSSKKKHQQITTLQNPKNYFCPRKKFFFRFRPAIGILEALAKRSMSMETSGSGKSQLGLLDPKKNKNGRKIQKTVWTDGFKDGGIFTQIDGKVCVCVCFCIGESDTSVP